MNTRNYTFKAIILSAMYWLLDSMVHKLIFSENEFEFIPTDANELWMRIIIIVLLIAFGIYADKTTKAMLKKEHEKRVVFNATISSTQHILNNLLNQMQYFKLMADESKAFDSKIQAQYDNTMLEGKELVDKLSAVEELTEANIKASVEPTTKK